MFLNITNWVLYYQAECLLGSAFGVTSVEGQGGRQDGVVGRVDPPRMCRAAYARMPGLWSSNGLSEVSALRGREPV